MVRGVRSRRAEGVAVMSRKPAAWACALLFGLSGCASLQSTTATRLEPVLSNWGNRLTSFWKSEGAGGASASSEWPPMGEYQASRDGVTGAEGTRGARLAGTSEPDDDGGRASTRVRGGLNTRDDARGVGRYYPGLAGRTETDPRSRPLGDTISREELAARMQARAERARGERAAARTARVGASDLRAEATRTGSPLDAETTPTLAVAIELPVAPEEPATLTAGREPMRGRAPESSSTSKPLRVARRDPVEAAEPSPRRFERRVSALPDDRPTTAPTGGWTPALPKKADKPRIPPAEVSDGPGVIVLPRDDDQSRLLPAEIAPLPAERPAQGVALEDVQIPEELTPAPTKVEAKTEPKVEAKVEAKVESKAEVKVVPKAVLERTASAAVKPVAAATEHRSEAAVAPSRAGRAFLALWATRREFEPESDARSLIDKYVMESGEDLGGKLKAIERARLASSGSASGLKWGEGRWGRWLPSWKTSSWKLPRLTKLFEPAARPARQGETLRGEKLDARARTASTSGEAEATTRPERAVGVAEERPSASKIEAKREWKVGSEPRGDGSATGVVRLGPPWSGRPRAVEPMPRFAIPTFPSTYYEADRGVTTTASKPTSTGVQGEAKPSEVASDASSSKSESSVLGRAWTRFRGRVQDLTKLATGAKAESEGPRG